MSNIVEISSENMKYKFDKIPIVPGVFIAGGAIRDSIIGEKYDDIDLFGDKGLLEEQFKKLKDDNWELVYDTQDLKTFKKEGIKVQIISRNDTRYIESCLNEFDFTVCQFAYSPDTEKLFCNPDSIIHLYEKKLVLNPNGIPYPFDTLRRMQKYIKKGYTICNGGLAELGKYIREMSDEDLSSQVQFYPDKSVRIQRWD